VNGPPESSATGAPAGVPGWDREGDLDQARAQIGCRVADLGAAPGHSLWLAPADRPDHQLARITESGTSPVVGSDCALWTWSAADLDRLSRLLQERNGVLVFLEPTAGLGLRRAGQRLGRPWFERRLGHHFERDVPAELRAAGFIVTTQVRFRHGLVGDYVRGEARHFRPAG